MKSKQQLINESVELFNIAQEVQDETLSQQQREAILKTVENKYHSWYRDALLLFDQYQQAENRQLFEQEYSGSFWSAKIIKFLTSGSESNPFYIPDNPLTNKWKYPFVTSFQEPFLKQCNILASLETTSTAPIKEAEDGLWNATLCRIFRVFIEKAENAKTTHEKKLTYEYLAIFLIGAIEGLTVIGHDERGAAEEIDLWVTNESKDNFWQRIGDVFIVECKNWGEPVGVQQVRNLKSIMQDKNVSFALLLSKKGITGDNWHDALDIVRKAVKDSIHMVVLTHIDLLDIAKGTSPTLKIKQKYYELLMKS